MVFVVFVVVVIQYTSLRLFVISHVQDGNTALMFAAGNGRDASAAVLITSGANIRAKNKVFFFVYWYIDLMF